MMACDTIDGIVTYMWWFDCNIVLYHIMLDKYNGFQFIFRSNVIKKRIEHNDREKSVSDDFGISM